ncbi:pyridoxamine 5'-phosphate oxidase family protein [Streptomyces sp. ODS05-4]|uniref:pyridoxamine 5'-phosphate oxidase family protein n=1 Tax=Streptomyces sp. ODS05-4 TaxID=2944939 RepID=UPI00210F2155|nr:pyridoxamine 5'-phosphate oxidase family protein [Streptomyces sp. ODS05-4]
MHSATPDGPGAALPSGPDAVAGALELLRRVAWGRAAVTRQAMPFMASARHVVTREGVLLLRLHRGLDCHRALDGAVVAYAADNLTSGDRALWTAQCTGTAHLAEPDERQQALFGPRPRRADGAPYEPVYLRLDPQFATVHTLDV